MERVLICGGAGYIGSHAVAEFLERGYDVAVLDNLEKGHREAVWDGAELFVGDLRDEVFVEKVFTETKIDVVIDFAAYSLVGESVAEPLKYYKNNVYGMINLLESMNRHNVGAIVFSSTASVYGEPEYLPITECARVNPVNPYGETKLAMERMLGWMDRAYGIKHAILRYFNVGGAHKSGKIGEDHEPETHLIPNVLKSVLNGGGDLKMFGDDYDTPDGTCIRDYIHITDLIEAHILALQKILSDDVSGIYNLGNGDGISNKEIITAAERVTGKHIPYAVVPRRPGDPARLVASSKKAMSDLGWKPKHGLNDIIASAWEWHSKNPKGYL